MFKICSTRREPSGGRRYSLVLRSVAAAGSRNSSTESCFDLTPDEPLTHAEVEALSVEVALHRCAWCDSDIDEGAGRVVGFKLPDRDRFAHREGLTLPAIDDEQVVVGIMSLPDSDLSGAAEDVVLRACTSRCEKALRKAVPKALRKVWN